MSSRVKKIAILANKDPEVKKIIKAKVEEYFRTRAESVMRSTSTMQQWLDFDSGMRVFDIENEIKELKGADVLDKMDLNEEMFQQFEDVIKRWTAEDGADAESKKCYAADRKDLKKVLSLMRQKKYVEAYRSACRLDTVVREAIPDMAWNKMERMAEEN